MFTMGTAITMNTIVTVIESRKCLIIKALQQNLIHLYTPKR